MGDAGKKELPRTGMRRKGRVSGDGYAGYAKKRKSGPLTERQEKILVALLAVVDEWYGMTGNEVAYAIGMQDGSDRSAHDGRSVALSNRVNFSVSGLEKRGLVTYAPRRDKLSGTARRLTNEGIIEARRIKGMAESNTRIDLGDAPGDAEAVWVVEGYADIENLEPVKASEVSFAPGTEVMFPEEHEMYGGATATVKAVGLGTGMMAGEVVYDVLVEGTSETERITEYDLEAA